MHSTSQSGHDIVALDAVAMMAAIRARTVSCREVMAAHLARIAAVNGGVNAIVSLRPADELLREADAADADLAAGRWRGPLHGLPHALKDLAAARGLRTTFGSPLFADNKPDRDALFVGRLRNAGAIFIGRTNVPEFGLGSNTYNPLFGITRNAFDQDYSAGGSSGGAAVALALHMVPLADGSDFAGSLRNPAGWNGVFGFRPSQGRVPSLPEPEGFLQQLSTDGPMARTVADLSLLLSVMSGFDPRAPLARTEPPLPPELLEGSVAGWRIGWLRDLDDALPMEDGILPLCEQALAVLGEAGCIVEDTSLGITADRIWTCWLTWRHALVAGKFRGLYADEAKRALLKPEMIWEIEGGASPLRGGSFRRLGGTHRHPKCLPDALRALRCGGAAQRAMFPFRRGPALAVDDRGPCDGQLSPLDGSRGAGHAIGLSSRCRAGWARRQPQPARRPPTHRPPRRRSCLVAARQGVRGPSPTVAAFTDLGFQKIRLFLLPLASGFTDLFEPPSASH